VREEWGSRAGWVGRVGAVVVVGGLGYEGGKAFGRYLWEDGWAGCRGGGGRLEGVDDEGCVWGQRFGEGEHVGTMGRPASYLVWAGGVDGRSLRLEGGFVDLVEGMVVVVVAAAAVAAKEGRVVVAEGRIVLGEALTAGVPEAGNNTAAAASVEIAYPAPQHQITIPSPPLYIVLEQILVSLARADSLNAETDRQTSSPPVVSSVPPPHPLPMAYASFYLLSPLDSALASSLHQGKKKQRTNAGILV